MTPMQDDADQRESSTVVVVAVVVVVVVGAIAGVDVEQAFAVVVVVVVAAAIVAVVAADPVDTAQSIGIGSWWNLLSSRRNGFAAAPELAKSSADSEQRNNPAVAHTLDLKPDTKP